MRHLKLELLPTLVMTKAVEIVRSLNIKENEFNASWGWFQNFRTQKGLKAVLMFGEGAEMNTTDPQLLESLDKLYAILRKYPPSCVYNMDETGLFHRLLPCYTLLMPNKDVSTVRGKRKSKDWVTLVVCANSDGSNKNPCCMIGNSKIPACSVDKHWPIPYCSQRKAWMDQPTYQKWFDTVFLPEVQKHTGSPVLLLLDNAPGHFNGLQKDGIQVEFFPPNCTSLKQPYDQGIFNALKSRYKFLY